MKAQFGLSSYLHMYLVEEEEEIPSDSNETQELTKLGVEGTGEIPLEISLHALAGDELPQLMRVEGCLRGK